MDARQDTLFSILSIETSSLVLASRLRDTARAASARAKLREAISNHQKTMGRLMRLEPLHDARLAFSMIIELGALQALTNQPNFGPSSAVWSQKATRWKELQAKEIDTVRKAAQEVIRQPASEATGNRLTKSFGLAVIATMMALMFDASSPRASNLLQELDNGKHAPLNWKHPTSPLHICRLLGVKG